MIKINGYSSEYVISDVHDGETFFVIFSEMIIIKDSFYIGTIILFDETPVEFDMVLKKNSLYIQFEKRNGMIMLNKIFDSSLFSFHFKDKSYYQNLILDNIYQIEVSIKEEFKEVFDYDQLVNNDHITESFESVEITTKNYSNKEIHEIEIIDAVLIDGTFNDRLIITHSDISKIEKALKQAVADEDYELAARLRDSKIDILKIKKFQKIKNE